MKKNSFTVPAPMTEEEHRKAEKRNLWTYPVGTVGRDMIYQLFTNYILTYTLFTRELTAAQLAAITGIMIAARIFDALNDPIMGNIIESTRTRFGKFKPWLLAGVISTSFVVAFIFNTRLTGWSYIIAFGICYFLYSITYTMNDISYWGMAPSLGRDADSRNKFTSRATLFAGIGATLATVAIPALTAGSGAIGGNAQTAYGAISLAICIFAPLCLCITIFGVKEDLSYMAEERPKVSFRTIVKTIFGNSQLVIAAAIFLLQQIGNQVIMGGVGSTYIYFEFGYNGSLFSVFSIVGMAATAVLMIGYPALSRKIDRKPLMTVMMIIAGIGYALILIAGLFFPAASTAKFVGITLGYMLSNFGSYCFYLVMMISIFNTVEYNELKHGFRGEGIITSLRPFITKAASAIIVGITTLTYITCGVLSYTNQISGFEQQANQGKIDAAGKAAAIDAVVKQVTGSQKAGLIIVMSIVPFLFMLFAWLLYEKKYLLDEKTYKQICSTIASRKEKASAKGITEAEYIAKYGTDEDKVPGLNHN
ncbi:MAG: glycoside-pentoside-hexuronide (GPH):cation symporter [Lachnospiraceae bacterium]|nr:glycoside-pentoside-hexuronide (GPH):cation symporter [Lachnospiraceae bacterium]